MNCVSGGIPQEEMTALFELIGCEPVFGDPQVTDTCAYQCAVGTTPKGPAAIFRTWPVFPKLFFYKSADLWIPAQLLLNNYDDNPIPNPLVSEQDWRDAKSQWDIQEEQRRKEAIMASWRGDDEAARYYSTPWNVQGLLQQDAIGWFYGAPGTYKTVLAMDIACSVSTGRPWAGRTTRKGPVLYISAEGGSGIYAMRDAWERKSGVKADHLAIYVGSPDISKDYTTYDPLISKLKEFQSLLGQPASLIVIDTYAQTSPDDTKATVTAYEKSIRAMIAKLAPGASALIVDHTTKEGATWMGSNAKLGNMDMMGMVKKVRDDIVLSMRNGKGKVKNAAPFEDIRMTPRLVDLGRDDAQGNAASAPVLEYLATTFTEREALALELIGDETTYGELRNAWHGHVKLASVAATTKKTALSRAIRVLREKDAIDVEGLEYEQTDDGAKERPITDTCVLLPM